MNLGMNPLSTSVIADRIDAAADQAARLGLFPTTVHETIGQAPADTVRIDCELLAVEQIACAFERFEVVNDGWKTASLAELKKIAETLAARLTYLMEPIRTIETDADTCTIQMRSMPPRKTDDGTRTYYELQVATGGKLSLCRYVKEPEQSRRKIPVQVTREVFRQLVADFVDAAGTSVKQASAA